jgi:hypothetical protein
MKKISFITKDLGKAKKERRASKASPRYSMAATTVAVNFSGDGGGGQDSVRSLKQKKRVTGAAIAATGLLSVPGF